MMGELITTIPAIIVIAYLVGMACKAIESVPDKYIPVIVGCVGAVLGVVGMYTMSEFPADNILNALAVGIASGLASTGANQIVKQLKQENDPDAKYWDDDDEVKK